MAHVTFQKNGVSREVKAGFSWTTLFFGSLVFACRGQWGWFFGSWLLAIATCGLSCLVFPFLANKMTARWLAERGWMIAHGATPSSWGIAQ